MPPKTCPPGVFCIENYTLVFLIITVTIAISYFLSRTKQLGTGTGNGTFFNILPSFPSDTLTNPYLPPLKDNRYFPAASMATYGVPINIKTRGFDTDYRQVGILTRSGGSSDVKETILPIMGRPLYANSSKWQFYTMSDGNQSVKLPISLNGRHCTGEYGCDDISNADTVYVEGYNQPFKVTMYENEFPRYIPIT